MKEQITRARFFFHQAEEGASQLEKASRWPVSISGITDIQCITVGKYHFHSFQTQNVT